jgi:hypothetical protein
MKALLINIRRLLFLLLLVSVLCNSCKNNKKQLTYAEQTVAEWRGKQIKFPENYQCCFLGKDTANDICTELYDKEYKILLYIDSVGCTDCRFNLAEWRVIMKDIGIDSFADRVGFLFFIQPENKTDLQNMLKNEKMKYPVFIDETNEINRLNHFPIPMEYQCFLLDKDNKVLLIGNPALNPKLWGLYKQIITGKIADEPPVTTVEPEKTGIELKDMKTGEISEAAFVLKNTGTNPLIIQRVEASCGCTVPEWEKQPVKAGKSAEIKVRITPKEKGHFNKTVTVYCNTEKGRILLKLNGTVKN